MSPDLELYYDEAGAGRPIIFIPGWAGTTEFYDLQMPYFAKSYRALTYDPRSQGRSSKTLENNHYLQTLKNSGLWEVYCGPKAYESIGELSGFDLATWVHENVDWKGDLQPELHDYLVQNDLVRYLSW